MDNILRSLRICDLQNPIPTREETEDARWAAGVTPKVLPSLVSAASWLADVLATSGMKHFEGLKAGSASGIPLRIINPAKLVNDVLPVAFGKVRASISL